MGQIDRTGSFRGYAVDSGVGKTKKSGLPQWIADLQAIEYYDEDTEQWIDWSQYDVNEITGYFVLFSKDKEATLNCRQIQKAIGWNGISTLELGSTDYSETLIQWRVEENTYEGKTSLQVTWIDHADAEPGRKLQKLDADELKKVDAQYAAALKKLSGGSKPKTVPAKPATPKPEVPKPSIDKEAAKAALKAKTVEKAERGKKAEEKAAGKKAPPKPQASKAKETCTLDQAWESVYAAKPEDTPDDKLNTLWLETIDKYGDQDTLTGEEWVAVRDEVISQLNP